MRLYKKLTYLSGIVSAVSFLVCLLLHYNFSGNESEFWVNVCLALFGSALLTTLSSIVSYFQERRSTLEGFAYHCKQILRILNKYQESMSLEEKMSFYLDYHDFDKTAFDVDYGNIDFFLEKFTGDREYIYQKIYLPILNFSKAVNSHVWHFRWYFDGSGKNTSAMEIFVNQLEHHLLFQEESELPATDVHHGNALEELISTESRLVSEISNQLNTRYYDILYLKKKHNLKLKEPKQ